MFKRVAGTKDILPEEAALWRQIEEISRNIFSLYNFQETRPPLIEEESLFNRSLGLSSEVVQKQMFLIKNKAETYVLRPEGTASIVRSYLENNLDKTKGFVKLYYIGSMFRLERPQKGRLRQFHHIGCEAIGSHQPNLDVEIISLADNLLRALLIEGYKIKINSLGCPRDKKVLAEKLHHALKSKLNQLCPECRVRFKKNTLRILDCKNSACRHTVQRIDILDTYLCSDCKGHFVKVRENLEALKIHYEVTPLLVRGLDYYTRTVFEITHRDLGAQDALGAGGRYDNLVKELGGPDLGAIGFAFGVERLLLARNQKPVTSNQNLVYIISLGDNAKIEGVKLLDSLRKNGIASDTDYENKSIKGTLRAANDAGARFVLIIGEDELKKGVVTLKDMASGEQEEIRANDLITKLKNMKPVSFVG